MPINARATAFTYGTSGNDVIAAQYLLGDMIDGLAGDDTITGLDGGDVLIGGAGRDTLYGMGGNDMLNGGAGNDRLFGGDGDDFLQPDSGGIGNDLIDGGAGIDTLSYADAPVTRGVRVDLRVTSTQDTLGAGKDRILNIENVAGTAFGDSLTGNGADNRLDGGLGNDTLNGMDGNDLLTGGSGNDVMSGGLGNDFFYADAGGPGNDVIDGGGGFDFVSYYLAGLSGGLAIDLNITAAQDTGGGGIDTFRGVEGVEGSDFADLLIGNAGDNRFSAGAGNDTVYGGDGNDWIYAGFGDGRSSNLLDGGNGNDMIEGSGGADTIFGGAGNDVIRVSSDRDVVEGGAGADLFFFRDGDSFTLNGLVADVIRDYNAAEDDIWIFTGGGSPAPELFSIFDLGDGGQRASFVFAGHGGVPTLFIDIYGSPVSAADFTFTSTDPFV